ncbi:MAG TPA: DUF945 family protein, partial [Gammaproteobacteria bacterium]|nr:DUF945 family protein [Gammaproteobacteria bacterium]
TRVHWQGVRLDLHKEDGRFRLDGRAPALAVATGPAGLRLEGVGLTSRFDERGDIWLGENRLRLARVAASGPVGFRVEGLQLRQRTSEPEPGRLRVTSALDIDVLTPEGGPAYRRFGYTLTMDRLDRAAYLELARTAAELRRADAGAGLHPGPAAPDLSGPLRRLLARSPRLALERLTVFGPHGTAEASASLTFHGTPDLDLSAGPALLRRLEFEGRFRVPKGMLEALIAAGLRREAARRETDRYELPAPEQSARVEAATQRRLRTFEQAGFIEADGGDYTARARLADGRVTVNGRPLALGGGALPIPEP